MIEGLGNNVNLIKSHERHFGMDAKLLKAGNDDFLGKFGAALSDAMQNTNNMQVESDRMNVQLAVDPESVDVHDVIIAQQKAQMSLDLTKAVIQKGIQAYQSLSNLR